MSKLKNIQLIFFQLLLLLSGLSLVMVLLKGAVSPFFGLYKEFFCVVIILLGINKLKFNYVFFVFILIFFIYSISSIISTQVYRPLDLYFYIYQFKIEFFYIILIFSLISMTRCHGDTVAAYERFKSIMFFLVIINILLAISQHIFFNDVIRILGFKGDVNGLRAEFGGIVIQTQNGLFRSIGTFSTPMALAEFLAFCLVFCAINIKKPVIKNLFVLICLVSIYFTSYKTTWTYLPALLFFIYMPTKSHRIFTNIYSISLLVFGFLSTHTYFMYDFFLDISPAYAEYSIRLRIEFVERIFYQMTHFTQYFFGAGYGFNGGLLEYLPGSVPLDSLYIYLLSNYGLISIFTLTLFFIVTICRMKNLKYSVFNDGDLGLFIIKNYILIMLSANLFWNNPIVNYPSLFFPLVCYILLIKKRKHERRSLDYAT